MAELSWRVAASWSKTIADFIGSQYVCECPEPQPFTRPSGMVICQECGGRIEPPQERKIRP